MDTGTWIAIYMPLFVIFFIIMPQQHLAQKLSIYKNQRKRRLKIMINEVIKKYIGKNCKISTGPYGTNVTGKIVEINENWIEVETRKGMELINAEFIQSIKVK